MFSTFAGIGLVLVVVGVYSLVAYTVSRQMHEIGIRMAVGASRGDILHMTVGMGIRWLAIGVVAGLLASLVATRAIASQLYEVDSNDPLTLAAVVGVRRARGLRGQLYSRVASDPCRPAHRASLRVNGHS